MPSQTYREHSIQKQQDYTDFLSAQGTFSRILHRLGHKTSLNKYKTEIISSIFSDHNNMKLETNYKKKTGKFTNIWRLNKHHPTEWVKKEIQRKKNTLIQVEMEIQHKKTYEMQQKDF